MAGSGLKARKAKETSDAGQRLKLAVDASGLSIREVARRTGVHHPSLIRAMRGESYIPPHNLRVVAKVLGVPYASIAVSGAEGQGVPVYGSIAAGPNGLDESPPDDHRMLPSDWNLGDDLFAFRVTGDSMIGAGIMDGDLVIARRSQRQHSGDIVVATIGDKTTLKRCVVRAGRTLFVPENPDQEPIEPIPDQTWIYGVAVAVMRLYEGGLPRR